MKPMAQAAFVTLSSIGAAFRRNWAGASVAHWRNGQDGPSGEFAPMRQSSRHAKHATPRVPVAKGQKAEKATGFTVTKK